MLAVMKGREFVLHFGVSGNVMQMQLVADALYGAADFRVKMTATVDLLHRVGY